VSGAGDAPWRWTVRGLLRASSIAVVAVSTGAALGYLVAHESTPKGSDAKREPEGPVPAELLLLAPLHEGSTLAGFDVAEIHPVGDDGALRISCRNARASVWITVTLAEPAGGSAPAPAAVAGSYAVSYALEKEATPAEGERLARSFAAILEANAGASPPPRLGPSRPAHR
jgi:hypothetical protein